MRGAWMVFVVAILLSTACARDPQPASKVIPSDQAAEETALHDASDAYLAAFNKGDVEALMNVWSADPEYINGPGEVFRGRDAVSDYFRLELAAIQGSKLQCEIDGLRFFKPDLVVEDGHATLTAPDGKILAGRYNAVWVKASDGKWKVARIQDLPPDPQEDIKIEELIEETETP